MCCLVLISASGLELAVNFPGQYFDVLKLFQLTGEPTETHALLMNGDLVDRGSWSIEVILTAFAFKCIFIFESMAPVGFDMVKRAIPDGDVYQSWKPRDKRYEPDLWL